MNFFRPDYRPGTNKRDTGLQNEGGFSASNMVRYKDKMAQPIGGWLLKSVSKFTGLGRGNHAWRTLEGKQVYAIGTTTGLFAYLGGSLKDITPPLHQSVLLNAFTTVSGSPTVTVYLPFHLLSPGDTVVFSNHQTTVGGLTIEGTYAVVDAPTIGTFTITAGSNAASTVSTPGGGYVDFVAALPAGLEDNPTLGYGTGSYGTGSYGTSGDMAIELRTWSVDNWGEFLMANPTGFGLFEWQPEANYPELAFNGTFTGNANGWALGTGWTYAANAVTATAGVASNLSQNVTDVLQGGRTIRATFTVTRSAGTLKLRMNAGAVPAVIDVGDASSPISKSGTYSRVFLCPADAKDIVFEKDSTFAGSIDNVSYSVESKAYRITTAPARIDSMFVDPRGIVVALGTTFIDGSYSPTAARNSDLGNNRSWVPDTASYASEYNIRGGGGRLMQGLATSEQNLVGADDGVFSFQWKAAFGAAYDIKLLGTKCGLISRHAMAEQNGFVGWMSNSNNFFFFRGVSSYSLGKPEVIECQIQEDVFNNVDQRQALKCYAGVNPEFTEIWFSYPDARDGQECSRMAVVDWTSGTWVTHTIARTSWQASGVFENPLAVSTDGYIFEHESGFTANGQILGATITTSDFDQGEGDSLLIFKGIIPDFKDQEGDIAFRIFGRNYPNETPRLLGEYFSGPTTRRVNFRHKARQYMVEMAWVTAGGWGRAGAIRYDVQNTGARQ